VTKGNNLLPKFLYHIKGHSFSILTRRMVDGDDPISLLENDVNELECVVTKSGHKIYESCSV